MSRGVSSPSEICNEALMHIKQTRTLISNFDTDEGNTADVVRTHYHTSRKFVLADHNWQFNRRRVALTDLGNPPPIWQFRYDYPSDCLKFREIENLDPTYPPIPFLVELNENGQSLCILSNHPEARGIYSVDITNPILYPPGFVKAFGWYLASEIAPALSEDTKMQGNCLQIYQSVMRSAQATDSQETQSQPEPDAPWDRVRLGHGGFGSHGV